MIFIRKKEKIMQIHLRKKRTKNIFIFLDKAMNKGTFFILDNQWEYKLDYRLTKILIVMV